MKHLPVTSWAAIGAALTLSLPAAGALHRAGVPSTQHLYVGVDQGQVPEILRFPFVNGFPAATPDLVYQDVLEPFNVGRDGTLYATVPLDCCQGLGTIDVFPPNSNQVSRQVTLPYLHEDTTIVTAVAEGPGRYLYIGYSAFPSGVGSRSAASATEDHRRFHLPAGYAVYPPDANGGGRPLRRFGVPRDVSGPMAIAFDRPGNLYFSTMSGDDVHNRVYTISNPLVKPSVSSVLDVVSAQMWGLEFSDGGRELYTLALGLAPPVIAVYAYGAHGHAQPLRTITLAENSGSGLGIAGPNVYVGVYGASEVVAYDKHASGSPPPVFTLNLPGGYTGPIGVAIGR